MRTAHVLSDLLFTMGPFSRMRIPSKAPHSFFLLKIYISTIYGNTASVSVGSEIETLASG